MCVEYNKFYLFSKAEVTSYKNPPVRRDFRIFRFFASIFFVWWKFDKRVFRGERASKNTTFTCRTLFRQTKGKGWKSRFSEKFGLCRFSAPKKVQEITSTRDIFAAIKRIGTPFGTPVEGTRTHLFIAGNSSRGKIVPVTRVLNFKKRHFSFLTGSDVTHVKFEARIVFSGNFYITY